MTYEELERAWSDALRESGLESIAIDPLREILDLVVMFGRVCTALHA